MHALPAPCRSPAAAAYRALLRAARATFARDLAAQRRCRDEARTHFLAHAHESDAPRLRQLLFDAHDAAAFLRQSVVQATLNEASGHYEMKVHAGESLRVEDAAGAAAAAESASPSAQSAAGGCGREGGCGCAGAAAPT